MAVAKGKKRLALLAAYLEDTEFAPGKFHLGTWMSGYKAMMAHVRFADPAMKDLEKRAAEMGDKKHAFKVVNPAPGVLTAAAAAGAIKRVEPIECRTAGCAIGWGIYGIPSFQEEGLSFTSLAHSLTSDVHAGIVYETPAGLRFTGMDACRKFFSLEDPIVQALFVQGKYVVAERSDPKAVAGRIREYLATGKVTVPSALERVAY